MRMIIYWFHPFLCMKRLGTTSRSSSGSAGKLRRECSSSQCIIQVIKRKCHASWCISRSHFAKQCIMHLVTTCGMLYFGRRRGNRRLCYRWDEMGGRDALACSASTNWSKINNIIIIIIPLILIILARRELWNAKLYYKVIMHKLSDNKKIRDNYTNITHSFIWMEEIPFDPKIFRYYNIATKNLFLQENLFFGMNT